MRLATAMTEEEEQQPSEIRRFGRHRIMLSCETCSVHGEAPAVLLDLSRGGAMLSASPPLPIGCRLVLVRRGLEAPAVVRWRDGNRFGVQFDEEIDENVVDYLVSRGATPTAH